MLVVTQWTKFIVARSVTRGNSALILVNCFDASASSSASDGPNTALPDEDENTADSNPKKAIEKRKIKLGEGI